jgi:hypothetical protein
MRIVLIAMMDTIPTLLLVLLAKIVADMCNRNATTAMEPEK